MHCTRDVSVKGGMDWLAVASRGTRKGGREEGREEGSDTGMTWGGRVAHLETQSYPDLQTPWLILQTAGDATMLGRDGAGRGRAGKGRWKAGRRDVGL